MPLLDDKTIQHELQGLSGWSRDGKTLWKLFKFNDFMDGIAFVNRVAETAEQLEHHPDLHVGYGTVKVVTWSHDLDGITERDVRLARAVDQLAKTGGSG